MKEIHTNIQALDSRRCHHNIFDGYDNDSIQFELIFDDECPRCGYGMDMGKESWHMFHDISQDKQVECKVTCVHYCPHCHESFVTEHRMLKGHNFYKELVHNVYPYVSDKLDISDGIRKISEGFVNIYSQARSAKKYGLSDIYGMALRKAFEHLVKDFALYNNPDKEEEIASKKLATCINDYIDNKKIKALCTSCRLIGNNETHWKNDNTAEDLIFLEKVLNAVTHFIEQEIVVLEAEEYNNIHQKR